MNINSIRARQAQGPGHRDTVWQSPRSPRTTPKESKNRHAKHLRHIHKIGAVLCVYGSGSQAEPCKKRGSNNPSAASGMKRRPVQSDKRLNQTLKTNTFWLAQLKSHVRPSNKARHRWTQPPPHTETTKPRKRPSSQPTTGGEKGPPPERNSDRGISENSGDHQHDGPKRPTASINAI